MTIYIVSYTCYDEFDNNLYTWRKPLTNWLDALELFNANVNTAREDISFNVDEEVDYDEIKEDFSYTFEREDSYCKIIVELTSHEL